jgi:GntR family transcriptional regulator, transcriptional repressor for pyruvate dehydrogenase complex
VGGETVASAAGMGQMRQPRLAEMVAAVLRDRIVGGVLADGDEVAGLDKLVKEFGVSPPSVREALRILENEGLITVRRGNVGGAVVHRPTAEAAAYMFGLVLQTERVPVTDLVEALAQLEPLCTRLCAARTDRKRQVVPGLKRALRDSERALDDAVAFEEACQQFHRRLVEGCGNRSLMLMVTAFERLWHDQQQGWAHRVSVLHEYPDIQLRQEGLDAHIALLAAVEEGDALGAERLAYEHLRHPRIRALADRGDTTVRAGAMGGRRSLNRKLT